MRQIAVFDSSALAKRYLPQEVNAARVVSICAGTANRVVISRLVSIELASAMARRVHDGTLSRAHRAAAWEIFRAHVTHQYEVVDLHEAVCDRAETLVTSLRVRTLDAIHLASAQSVLNALGVGDTLTFYTADRPQADAALALGLVVDFIGGQP